MNNSTGVIILGGEYQALGQLRQLREEQVPCALVDQDSWGVARFSRHRCPFHNSPKYTSDEFWPWLVALARKHNYLGWVLVPTDDEQVRQIALHFKEAKELFRCGGLPWDEYRLIYDKRANYEWCLKHGVVTPVSFAPQSRTDRPGSDLPYPLIIKPAFKRNYSKHCKAKAIRVESPAEMQAVLDGPLAEVPVEELLYQEIIPGDGRQQWSYAGLFSNGQPLAAFTACRRRQHPPDFGRASTYVIAEHDAEVERESRRVMEILKFTGLAEVEWKRDLKTGRLKFLEVNARSWGWHSLAARVVGNVPKMHFDLLNGRAVPQVTPQYGWRWVKHVTDMPVAVDLWRRNEMSLGDYVRSLRGKTVCCEWGKGDPWPFFLQWTLVPYLMIKRGY
jgi:D-aspartate ligase